MICVESEVMYYRVQLVDTTGTSWKKGGHRERPFCHWKFSLFRFSQLVRRKKNRKIKSWRKKEKGKSEKCQAIRWCQGKLERFVSLWSVSCGQWQCVDRKSFSSWILCRALFLFPWPRFKFTHCRSIFSLGSLFFLLCPISCISHFKLRRVVYWGTHGISSVSTRDTNINVWLKIPK